MKCKIIEIQGENIKYVEEINSILIERQNLIKEIQVLEAKMRKDRIYCDQLENTNRDIDKWLEWIRGREENKQRKVEYLTKINIELINIIEQLRVNQ